MQDKEQLKLELDEAKAEVEEIQSQQEGIKKAFCTFIWWKIRDFCM